jgi:hypothetical protein
VVERGAIWCIGRRKQDNMVAHARALLRVEYANDMSENAYDVNLSITLRMGFSSFNEIARIMDKTCTPVI